MNPRESRGTIPTLRASFITRSRASMTSAWHTSSLAVVCKVLMGPTSVSRAGGRVGGAPAFSFQRGPGRARHTRPGRGTARRDGGLGGGGVGRRRGPGGGADPGPPSSFDAPTQPGLDQGWWHRVAGDALVHLARQPSKVASAGGTVAPHWSDVLQHALRVSWLPSTLASGQSMT